MTNILGEDMIFDFTESPESEAKRQAERDKRNHWNKWFAWYPVKLSKCFSKFEDRKDNPFFYTKINKWGLEMLLKSLPKRVEFYKLQFDFLFNMDNPLSLKEEHEKPNYRIYYYKLEKLIYQIQQLIEDIKNGSIHDVFASSHIYIKETDDILKLLIGDYFSYR